MGVQISSIVISREVELNELSGKRIAIDAPNMLYQFLSIIRDRMTGEPLRDREGRITSHLSGLFYRTIRIVEAGIRPVFVFDGKAPKFKRSTLERREDVKREAEKKMREALARGEEALKYAQATAKLTAIMVEDSKKLLDYMGIPWVEAPSEGELQAAYLARKGDVFASASQDYDSLLAGTPRLVRNLSITGRRKLPNKEAWREIKPELIELDRILNGLGINRKQLVIIGILVGTDYNPGGIKGVGPKKALQLVRKEKTLERVLKKVEWNFDVMAEEIFDFFLNPPVSDEYELKWKEPNEEKLIKFMVDKHDFSLDRVSKGLEKLKSSFREGKQTSLAWFRC